MYRPADKGVSAFQTRCPLRIEEYLTPEAATVMMRGAIDSMSANQGTLLVGLTSAPEISGTIGRRPARVGKAPHCPELFSKSDCCCITAKRVAVCQLTELKRAQP